MNLAFHHIIESCFCWLHGKPLTYSFLIVCYCSLSQSVSFVCTGTLHVGDEIREINEVSVVNQTVDNLQKMLVKYLNIQIFIYKLSFMHTH